VRKFLTAKTSRDRISSIRAHISQSKQAIEGLIHVWVPRCLSKALVDKFVFERPQGFGNFSGTYMCCRSKFFLLRDNSGFDARNVDLRTIRFTDRVPHLCARCRHLFARNSNTNLKPSPLQSRAQLIFCVLRRSMHSSLHSWRSSCLARCVLSYASPA
jgi:hypothetical protein